MFKSVDNPAYDAALAFLYNRVDYERSHMPDRGRGLSLDRMRELLAQLGDPHRKLKIVHIAGTKGKGSTAAMIAAVLHAAGYKTGLYTSPHLDRVEERIAIDGEPCSETEFAGLVEHVRAAVERLDAEERQRGQTGPTFFEITTAMMFAYFARQAVDAAVLEVGLGGRLDSTNVCQPLMTVITSISFDHMRQLGNTLAEIAGEKGGIIKPGVPVVSGVVEQEPRQVIESIAQDRGSRLIALGREFDFEYLDAGRQLANARGDSSTALLCSRLAYRECVDGERFSLPDATVGLPGVHQARNAAVALATLRRLEKIGWRITAAAMRNGLASVRCSARVELLAKRPAIVLDVAHNVASVDALLHVLDERLPAAPRILIFGVSRDKDVTGMLRKLVPAFETIILTRFIENPRSVPPEELASIAQRWQHDASSQSAARSTPTDIVVCQSPRQAWDAALRVLTPEHSLCVTGSFFLAAEMRPILLSFLAEQHLPLQTRHETIEVAKASP